MENKLKNSRGAPARQQGFVLFIALVVLVAMSLAGIALVRSVDTSNQVANNITFKQSTVMSAENGAELAAAWLLANSGLLEQDLPASGYYATEQQMLDILGDETPADLTDDVDWNGTKPSAVTKAKSIAAADAAGNKIAYVIHRMCAAPGPPDTSGCASSLSTTSGVTSSTKGGASYGQYAFSGKSQYFYRVTTRTTGPKNTVSYLQAMLLY